jgi:hypothetical protein
MGTSILSALETLAGRVVPFLSGNRISLLQAQGICSCAAEVLRRKAVSPEWIQICQTYELDPIAKGLRILDHVLLHLDLELRRN